MTPAPQAGLSTSSSTAANRFPSGRLPYYYIEKHLLCQPLISLFPKVFPPSGKAARRALPWAEKCASDLAQDLSDGIDDDQVCREVPGHGPLVDEHQLPPGVILDEPCRRIDVEAGADDQHDIRL